MEEKKKGTLKEVEVALLTGLDIIQQVEALDKQRVHRDKEYWKLMRKRERQIAGKRMLR